MNSSKKQQIIDTAGKLFWKFGIKRITVEEVCLESKVSKMTFYKYFKNKNELVKFFIDQLIENGMNKYRSIMDSDLPFIEKVEKSIELKMELSDHMSTEFFTDFYKNAASELRDHLNEINHINLQAILNDYVEAQKKGDIRKDLKPEFILYFVDKIIEMTNDEKLLKLYNTPQDLIKEIINFFFYGILSRKIER